MARLCTLRLACRALLICVFVAGCAGPGPGGEELVRNYNSTNIPGPDNRWVGRNRVAFMNAEVDRLVEAFNTTLDRGQRNQQVVQMARIFSDELPEISLYFDPSSLAYVNGLQGPKPVAPKGIVGWDIHLWEFR